MRQHHERRTSAAERRAELRELNRAVLEEVSVRDRNTAERSERARYLNSAVLEGVTLRAPTDVQREATEREAATASIGPVDAGRVGRAALLMQIRRWAHLKYL